MRVIEKISIKWSVPMIHIDVIMIVEIFVIVINTEDDF